MKNYILPVVLALAIVGGSSLADAAATAKRVTSPVAVPRECYTSKAIIKITPSGRYCVTPAGLFRLGGA